MKTPLERIKAVIPAEIASEEQLAKVVAGDVVAVAGKLALDRQTDVTRALLMGASAERPDRTVAQKVVDLHHLIEQAEGSP